MSFVVSICCNMATDVLHAFEHFEKIYSHITHVVKSHAIKSDKLHVAWSHSHGGLFAQFTDVT